MLKTLPALSDHKRIRSLVRNIRLCAELTHAELHAIEESARLEPGTITRWEEVGGEIDCETLSSIADHFNLRYIDLLCPQGPDDTRRMTLQRCLDGDMHSEAPLPNLSRLGRSLAPQRAAADSRFENGHGTSFTQRSPRMSKMAEKAAVSQSPLEITWDETNTIAKVGGIYHDLMRENIRSRVASNVLLKNPFMTVQALTSELHPPRKAQWLYNLKSGKGRIERSDIEQLAELCKTTVDVLLI